MVRKGSPVRVRQRAFTPNAGISAPADDQNAATSSNILHHMLHHSTLRNTPEEPKSLPPISLAALTIVLALMALAAILHTPPKAHALSAYWPPFTYGNASAYGPGLYGRRTACGQTLYRNTVGAAHRTLPCGTRITVCHNRRCAIVRVIDRGPFVHGRVLDLTEPTTRYYWNASAIQWGVRRVAYRKTDA